MPVLILSLLVLGSLALLACSYRLLKKLKSTHYVWRKVGDEKLNRQIRESVSTIDSEFLQCRFRFCGNFQSIWKLSDSVSRCFLHDNGYIRAEWSATGSVVFHSLFADGSVIETCSLEELPECLDNLSPDSRLILVAGGSKDVSTLLQRHLLELEKVAAQRSTELLKIPIQLHGELNRYLLSLCDWQLYISGNAHFQPLPNTFELPLNMGSNFIFPTKREIQRLTLSRKQKQLSNEKPAKVGILPSTREDFKTLAYCIVFYTSFTLGTGGLYCYWMIQRSKLAPQETEGLLLKAICLFAFAGILISMLFFASYKKDSGRRRTSA